MQGFPFKTHPSGWFQAGWSTELPPGGVSKLRLFGRDVVLYRTHSGVARLVDAHCPHLGAHLGFGEVVGECIRCPFHGWEFDPSGQNVKIPFSEHPKSNVALTQWTIEESHGVILVWHDAGGREPFYRWPGVPELDDAADHYPTQRHYAGVRRILPQQMFENGPDALHFCFVHGSGEPAEIVEWEEDFPFLHYVAELRFGVGKAPTWLTPDGEVTAVIRSQATIGLGVVRFHFDDMLVTQLVGMTPVDDDHSMAFSTTAGKRNPLHPDEPDARTVGMMKFQHAQIERDFSIWENQVYVERPPFAGAEERHFARFRRWVDRFYPETEAGATAHLSVIGGSGER